MSPLAAIVTTRLVGAVLLTGRGCCDRNARLRVGNRTWLPMSCVAIAAAVCRNFLPNPASQQLIHLCKQQHTNVRCYWDCTIGMCEKPSRCYLGSVCLQASYRCGLIMSLTYGRQTRLVDVPLPFSGSLTAGPDAAAAAAAATNAVRGKS